MKKLNRYKEHRLSMLRNLSISLIEHGKIITTKQRTKELKSFFEPLLTTAKTKTLTTRRSLLSKLNNRTDIVNKLFEVAELNLARPGGYTSSIPCGFRSDGGAKSLIRILDYKKQAEKDPKTEDSKTNPTIEEKE